MANFLGSQDGGFDKKKLAIGSGIVVVCLGSAWFLYSSMSDHSSKETPQLKAAEAKADQITTAMKTDQQKAPAPPPEKPLPPHKGKMAAPK